LVADWALSLDAEVADADVAGATRDDLGGSGVGLGPDGDDLGDSADLSLDLLVFTGLVGAGVSDADAALGHEADWASSNDLAAVVLQGGTFWTLGWHALSVLVDLVWKSAESSETFAVLHEVAGWADISLALSVDQVEILRAASSGADTVLHGESFSAVFVADARDELVAVWTADSDAFAVDELVVLVAFSADAAGALLD
jgi:hypothetical protein